MSKAAGAMMVLFAALGTLSAFGQTQQTAQPQEPATKIEAVVQEVVLDLVVRDKKGRPVRDLKPEEIEVLEDGAPQKLNSFRLIEGQLDLEKRRERAGQPPAAVAGELDPLRQVRLITLVFERLGVEGKRFFRQAVDDLLKMSPEPNLYYALFTIEQKLHLLQNFTSNHDAFKKQTEAAQKGAYVQFASRSSEIQRELQNMVRARQAAMQAEAAGGPAASAVGAAMVEAKMAEMQLNMLQLAETLERDYYMRSTLNSLIAVVRGQAELPGRKMVVYFTEWFVVPENLVELYRSLMSEANRANVTIYCVDAKGLVTWSQNAAGVSSIASAAGSSQAHLQEQAEGGVPVSVDQVKVFDTVQEGLRSNVQVFLRELSTSTGGFLITDTNDLRAPLRRTLEELRTYYEAAYTPKITTYDGKFRTLAVRVSRPDVTVQSRNGYFALPPVKGGQQLFAYEMPLLGALNQNPPPNDIEFRAAAERYNPRGEKVQYSVVMEVPMKGLQFQADEQKQVARTRASLLALFKDERGEIVSKFSRDFPLQTPLDKMAGFQAGNLIQMNSFELPPGRYVMETAVVDRNAEKAGTKRSVVVVVPPTKGLSISSVTLLRRVEPMKEEPDPSNPYQSEGGRVTPTLANTIKAEPGAQLNFYFVIYPEEGNSAAPELTMNFYSGDQLLGGGNPALPKADKHGRISYVATVPAESFPPGQYQMRAIAKQGAASAEESISFTVQ